MKLSAFSFLNFLSRKANRVLYLYKRDGVMRLSTFKLLSAFFRLVIDGCTLTFCMSQDGGFSKFGTSRQNYVMLWKRRNGAAT